MDTQGRTSSSYDDFWADDDQPRLYKVTSLEDGWTVHAKLPCGHVGHLSDHIVDEHDDGTFSITPQPNPPGIAMNSVLCGIDGCGWHGYVDHNRWYTI